MAADVDRLMGELLGSDPLVGNRAADELAAAGPVVLPRLLDAADAYNLTEQRSHRLPKLLARFDHDRLIQALAEQIKTGGWGRKMAAAQCLAAFPREPVKEAVATLLDHDDPDVVRCAIDALGQVGADTRGRDVWDLLNSSEYHYGKYRPNALRMFARCIARETVDREVWGRMHWLTKLLLERPTWEGAYKSHHVHSDIYDLTELFEEFTHVAADAVTAHWLHGKDPLFRELAGHALGCIGLHRLVTPLTDRLRDQGAELNARCAAAHAIGRIDTPAAATALTSVFHDLPPQDVVKSRNGSTLTETVGFGLSLCVYRLPAAGAAAVWLRLHGQGDETASQAVYALCFVPGFNTELDAAAESKDWLTRAAAGLALAYRQGNAVAERLSDMERGAANPAERRLLLAALIRAGRPEADRLHHDLCGMQYPYGSFHKFRPMWRREILWALAQGGQIGRERAAAWADLAGVDLDADLRKLPGGNIPPPSPPAAAPAPAPAVIAVADPPRLDVLVINALYDELKGVLAVTDGRPGEAWAKNTFDRPGQPRFPYHTRELVWPDGTTIRAAAVWTGEMGETAAAVRAAVLARELNPRVLAMTGICAGKRGDVALGDVILADRVYSYDHGKLVAGEGGPTLFRDIETYGLEKWWRVEAGYFADDTGWADGLVGTRPPSVVWQRRWLLGRLLDHEGGAGGHPAGAPDRTTRCPGWSQLLPRLLTTGAVEIDPDGVIRLAAAGRTEARTDRAIHPDGPPGDPPFRVHVSAIATGKTVREDPALFDLLKKAGVRKTLGVEMEAAAIGYVGDLIDRPAVIAKAVSDYGDHDKDDGFRQFACRSSAECLFAFLRRQFAAGPPRSP